MSITPDVLEQIADELHGIPDNEAKISFPCPTHGAFAASISLTGSEKLEAMCADGCETKALWRDLVKESATLARLWAEKSREKEEKPKARASGPGAEVKHDNEKSGLMQPPRPETQKDRHAERKPDPDALSKAPPQAVDTERCLLGSVLIAREQRTVLYQIAEIISADDFYWPSHALIYQAMLRLDERGSGIDIYTLRDEMGATLVEKVGGVGYLAELAEIVPTAMNAAEYARTVHKKAQDRKLISLSVNLGEAVQNGGDVQALAARINQVALNGTAPDTERSLTIVCEEADQAIISNAEYLSRPALVAQLYYTHHISLGVGGKHEGKTTISKTEALSLACGDSIYGREAVQTPVIYAASEDEYPSVRMDLIQMGWNPAIPLIMVKIADNADRDFVLEDIAALALKRGVSFVVLDMLFDFTKIQDELKYAHTREATGKVQQLADAINGHVRATHHSPKWMPDAASAAKAALGSQGIAARFSPITLSKMWVEPKFNEKHELIQPGLYTIESTMTRDPRGRALPVTVVKRDQRGWAVATEEFKAWMKWPVYAQRIIDLFEMTEPDKWLTVAGVARDLELSKPDVQNAMLRMTEGPRPVLKRTRLLGKAYTYQLINRDPQRDRVSPAAPKQDDENDQELDEYGIPKSF